MKKKEKIVDSEEKKEKPKEGKLKTKWKTWMTVVTVIAGVLLISGITVLGVFFAGGFDEKFIYPEAITYYYDEHLLNNDNGYIEIDDDLSLALLTETPEVTRKSVQLSFDEGVPVYRPTSGYISDGTIIVPEYVQIGKQFSVRRATTHITDKDGNTVDWVAGGLSRLWATSENTEIEGISIQIAVDVPVYQTETIILNSKGEETSTIVKNESFTTKTKFYPENSQYMYSDGLKQIDENVKRLKKSYFEQIDTNDITSIYDGNNQIHFVASDRKVNNIKINGYTFAMAKTQLEYEADPAHEDVGDAEYYYTTALTYLSDNVDLSKMSTGVFNIDEENIGHFKVEKEGMTIPMRVNEELNIYLNQYLHASNSDYLGVSVYSASGLILDNLLPNIAVTFERSGKDPTIGTNRLLTVIGGGEPIVIDDVTYYRPIATGKDKRYSYWRLLASDTAEIKMRVVLLVNDCTELYRLSSSETPLVRDVNLSITKHEEKPVSWTDQSQLDILLDYTNEGGISSLQPKTLNLEQFAYVPADNIYQDKVFFISFGNGKIEDYIETANDVIGANGYIRERSGVYSTNSGNLTLFAVDGARVTIYNTCEFSLYFATVKEELAPNGLYQFVQMVSGGKRIVCEKALYTDSVEGYDIASTEGKYPTVNNEISINQGNTNEFVFSFIIKTESVPVFTDEFQKERMTPKILDRAGNDITEYFNFDDGTLIDIENSDKKALSYSITSKSSVEIGSDIGIYFGYFVLSYDNGKDEPIVWQFALRSEHIINLYNPKAVSINLTENELSKALLIDGNKIELNQNLTETSNFKTTIQVKLENGTTQIYNSINEFINKLVGTNGSGITITDQKHREDTLKGKWIFEVESGDSNIISFTPEKQSFSFKTTDSKDGVPLSLVIKSVDKNATLMKSSTREFKIEFIVKSTGITKILYDSSASTYNAAPTTQNPDTSKVDISKYGAKGNADNYIVLNDIVKFYCKTDNGEIEYNKILFKFNPQFYSTTYLSDAQITDLFGLDGMLELYQGNNKVTFGGSYTPDSIRSSLTSLSVNKIKINKNFASSLSIPFIVSDESGAVNTAFNLNLTENLSVSNESYRDVYAGAENKIELTNTVTNINAGGAENNITSLYNPNNAYYIILDTDGRYILKDLRAKPSGAVGELSQGQLNVYFYDFWETPEKSFTVYFQPEGQNSFALNHPITFNVKRDLLVTDQGGKFYVLGGNNEEISKFAKITRHDGETKIVSQDLGLTYEFSDYLQYKDAKVQRLEQADFFFDYNQQSLYSTLTIKYGNVIFGEINIEIKLVEALDVYAEIASKFILEANPNITAKTQIINNGNENVEYLVIPFNAGSVWETNKIGKDGTYFITPSQEDHDKIKNKDLYTYSVGETEFKKQNQLLAGINNTRSFMALKFGTSETDIIAFMHMPLIISSLGFDTVVYENGNVAENRRMETSLLSPEELLKKGIYNEIHAGQLTTIINKYVFDEETNIKEGGLYILSSYDTISGSNTLDPNFTSYLKAYSLDGQYANYNDLIKNLNAVNGTIMLNHLSTSIEDDVYVALVYTLETKNGANKQEFYYLLKVLPDVNVEDSIYAYNGVAEYISANLNQENIIDFESIFGNNTLHNSEKRFMVNKVINLDLTDTTRAIDEVMIRVKGTGSATIAFTYNENTIYKTFKPDANSQSNEFNKEINITDDFEINSDNTVLEVSIVSGNATVYYNDVAMISTLKYTNSIESVQLKDKTFTNSTQWNPYITFRFTDDFSQLSFIPKTSDKMTVVVKHCYDSTSESSLMVKGGEQYYTFIINEDEEIFAVKYKYVIDENNIIEEESSNFTITFDNGAKEEGKKIYNLDINLLRKEESGSSIGTIIPNRLQVSLIEGKENFKSFIYEKEDKNDDGTEPIVLGSGKFQIILNDYIEFDKDIRFAAYTNVGLLSVFTIHLKANVTYMPSPKENANVLVGGQTQTLLQEVSSEGTTTPENPDLEGREGAEEVDEYPNFIRLDEGDKKNIPYEIKEINITGNGKDFVLVNKTEKTGSSVKVNGEELEGFEITSLTVADLISNKEITIDYVVNVEMDNTKPEKRFHFSQNYILQQNIIPKNSVTAIGETIAGTIREIDVLSLYTTKSDVPKSELTDIKITTTSSNPAFAGIDEYYNISTGQVSEKGTLELTLQVSFCYGNTAQTFAVNYSFVVAPSVKLEVNYPIPNSDGEMEFEYVEDKVEYPNIQTFVSSTPIFNSKPRFEVYSASLENGVAVYENKLENWQNSTDNYSVVINSQTNAYVLKGKRITDASGEVLTPSYNLNEIIEIDKILSFNRQRESGSDAIVELGLTFNSVSTYYTVKVLKDSLKMTTNTVSNFSTAGDYVNEETKEEGGESDKQPVKIPVNYETIYVDKTSTSNILEGGRLIYAQLSEKMASYSNDYYFVFAGTTTVGETTTTNYYASYPIFISREDQAKNLYYDLGISFNNTVIDGNEVTFEFYGLYLTSSVEDAKIKIDNNKHRQLVKTQVNGDDKPIESNELPNDFANNIFRVLDNKPLINIANRIQLTYGYDKNGNDLLVDYNNYKSMLEGNDLSIGIDTPLNKIIKHQKEPGKQLKLTLERGDGSERVEEFNLNYYYMANIDINMDAAISSAYNFIELEVEDEKDSLVSLFGLKHPTNGRPVKASDFSSGNSNLDFEVLNYRNGQIYKDGIVDTDATEKIDSKDKEIIDSYLTKYNITNGFNKSIKGKDYLYNATKINANGSYYDYSLTPLGAKNTGDYLLTSVKYKVGGFERVYYVVLKIVPDYVVSYGGSVDNAAPESNGTIISNYNNMKTFAAIDVDGSSRYYKSEQLTGENGYMTIYHKNTSDSELAVKNFEIKMLVNDVIDAISFNNISNIKEKVFYKNFDGTINLSDKWKPKDKEGNNVIIGIDLNIYDSIYTYDYDSSAGEISFRKVKEIFFGSQYYYFEGVDDYGYKFRLYFKFEATKRSPEIVNSITISEEGLFDLGALYQTLTIANTSSGESAGTKLSINASSLKEPLSADTNVQVVKFRGIEAWQYEKDYTKKIDDKNGPYLQFVEGGKDDKDNPIDIMPNQATYGKDVYKEITKDSLVNTGSYLQLPNLNYMAIEGIKLYNPETNQELATVRTYGGKSSLGSIANDAYSPPSDDGETEEVTSKWLMSTTDGYMFWNRARAPYGLIDVKKDDGTVEKDYHPNLWQIPKIKDTNIFRGSTTATVRMVITLKFDDGKVEQNDHKVEYCDCPINITVVRKANITQTGDSAVIDGKEIQLLGQDAHGVDQSKFKPTATGVSITSLINDTLEVSAPANRTTTFTISLIRNEEELYQTSVSVQNGESFAKTFYLSLSQYFDRNVEIGDVVLIDYTPPDNNTEAKFYYILDTNTKGTTGSPDITYKKLGETDKKEVKNKINFTISTITKDYIYVEDARLLSANNYYGVTKYYVAVCKYNNEMEEDYLYRVSGNYVVTGFVYKMNKKYTGSIGFAIDAKINVYTGPMEEFKNTKQNYATLNSWMNNAFEFKSATVTSGVQEKEWSQSIDTNILYFEIAESSDSSDSKIGRAYIDSEGTIILGSEWQSDQYIKINIKTKVSGPDRDINADGDTTYLPLGTLSLSHIK